MTKPTYQDAMLLLQLVQWGATIGMGEASSWVWSGHFIPDYTEFVKKYPRGSKEFLHASTICAYWETVGTFFKHGLLSEVLLFDWAGIAFAWDRVKGYVLGKRQEEDNLRLYENFEAMAEANVAYDAERIKGIGKVENLNK